MATMIGRTANRMTPPAAGSRRTTVRIETDACVYVGRLTVAASAHRVSDVLADDRQFLSLSDVRVNDGGHTQAYMAVHKSFIRSLRIVDEPAAC
jgi:hypothetical protein